MKKYWQVVKNTWEETTVYRLNFIMWRVRTVLQILTMYFLWLSLMPQDKVLFGYTQSLMLTYILGTSLISSIILSSRTIGIGDEINSGNLSNFLIRPINYFLYWFAKDVGDKALNIAFSLVELLILFFILRPPLFLQTNAIYLFLCLFSITLGVILYFFINFLIGLIGFWSPEVWAPRFIFMIILSFFAGGFFPLDILPKGIFFIFRITPFPYLLYFPLKVYLGQLAIFEIFIGLFMSGVWTFLMYRIVRFVWKKGLRVYSAEGR